VVLKVVKAADTRTIGGLPKLRAYLHGASKKF